MADNKQLDPVRMERVYKLVKEKMGFNKEQWDLYRNSQAEIESMGGEYISDPMNEKHIKSYTIPGGSGTNYDGRYQLGGAAKEDGVRVWNENNKTKLNPLSHGGDKNNAARVNFRSDPILQEEVFAGFTLANHGYLQTSTKYKHQIDAKENGSPIYSEFKKYTKSEEYKNADQLKKMQYLAHAHNSGFGNLAHFLETGDAFQDGFNTKSTKYMNNVKSNAQLQSIMFEETVSEEMDMRVKSAGDVFMENK